MKIRLAPVVRLLFILACFAATLLSIPTRTYASSLNTTPGVQYFADGSIFVLDASLVAAGEQNPTFQWVLTSRPAGSSAAFAAANAPITQLDADLPGSYTAELTITVNGVARAPIAVALSTLNNQPVSAIEAVGGVSPVAVGTAVQVSGAASSDPDGDALTYQWVLSTKPATSNATVVNPTGVFGSFVPDVAGVYEVQLTVSDPAGKTAVDTLRFATGSGVTVAYAGLDVVTQVGQAVFVDAFGSTQSQGAALSAAWRLVSAPQGSAAGLQTGGSLSPRQPGRVRFTPDVAGLYVFGTTTEGGGVSSRDALVIAAGPGVNVAPVASAGRDRIAAIGSPLALDASGSTDANGDLLSYTWSVVSKPAASAISIGGLAGPLATVTPDVAGLYVFQLTVSDGKRLGFDTVVVSTEAGVPVASAGPDKLLGQDNSAGVDASSSQATGGGLSGWLWSIVELATPGAKSAGTLSQPDQPLTNVSFASLPTNGGPAQAMAGNSLIVFENANIQSQVYGRTLVGGNLQGHTSDYANGLPQNNNPSNVVLTVGGNLNGQWINVNNGGSVRVGGQVNAGVNRNGGGTVTSGVPFDIQPVRQTLTDFSAQLAALSATNVVTLPGSQPGPVNLVAVPNADGVAVFNVSGSSLLDNNKVQQIDIQPGTASAIVINLSGNNVKFRQGNLVGNFNTATTRAKIIWNFYEANNIQLDRSISGAVLAPGAHLQVSTQTNGTVVARQLQQNAAITALGFGAAAAFAEPPLVIEAAVLQVKVSSGVYDSFATTLVTKANIAPVARPQADAADVAPGTEVTLNAAASNDANGDVLGYSWALLHRPADSTASLAPNNQTAKFTPDRRGVYVVQLVANDGALSSKPVTLAIVANNRAPEITSTAPTTGVTDEPYAYQATATDADGDTLSWSLANAPAGMTIDATTGLVSWLPDTAGSYSATLTVTDGHGGSASQTITITIEQGGNRYPPTIEPVANITLRPGERAAFTVQAADQDGDPVTIWATNLPAGATLNSGTGAVTYTAGEQTGEYTVTYTATDGFHTASTQAIITVVPWPASDPTRLSGVVLDAQDYANGITTPVVGATLTLNGQTTTTAAGGAFAYATATPGRTTLAVNGATAAVAPDGKTYGSARPGITIYKNSPNVLPEPILLNRLSGQAQLTEVDDDLPPHLRSCRILRADTSTGGNVTLATVGLTTSEALVPGTRAVVWAATTQTGDYSRIALGTVAADGRQLTGLTGSVPSGTNLLVTALPLTGSSSALQPTGLWDPSLLGEGNLQTGFSLPSYVSLGQQRAVSFLYNSVTADPRPIIVADVTIPAETTLTGRLEAELYVDGQRVTGEVSVDLQQGQSPTSTLPQQGLEATVSVAVAFDARAFKTGAHKYQLYVFAGQTCSAAAALVEGEVLINNRADSPYGVGWKPAELQELHPQPDGSVVVEDPDGGLTKFEQEKTVSLSQPKLYDLFDPERAEVSDLDKDGDIDILVAEGQTGDILIYRNDGAGLRTFTGPQRIDAGSNGGASSPGNEHTPDTNDVAVKDFNKDGRLDFATVHQHDNVAKVWLQNADGTFTSFQYSIGSSKSLGAGDFNGDGNQDIVVGHNGASASLFLGPLTAQTVRITKNLGSNVWDIEVADLNADGLDDIVSAATGSGSAILYGAANMTTATPISLATTAAPDALQQMVTIGDIDGDGSPEIAMTISGKVRVFEPLKDGTGKYRVLKDITLPLAGQPESVAIRDIFGDGKAELMVVNKTAKLFVYDVDALFGTASPLTIGISGSGDDTLTIADFDKDGIQDFVLFYASAVRGVPDNLAVHFGEGSLTGKFLSPSGDFSGIARNPDGSFTRRYKDGTTVQFNAEGLQTSLTDTNGNVTAYEYDTEGRLTKTTDPTGLTSVMTYTGRLLTRVEYSDGRVSTFEYDDQGNLIGNLQPNLSLPQSVTLPNGQVVTVGADGGSSHVYEGASVTVGNTVIKYSYDAQGRMTASIDERGKKITYNYEQAGRLQSSTLPNAASVSMQAAKSLGLATFGVDLGAPSQTKYIAPEERVTQLTDAKGNKAYQEVNQFGAVIKTIDPLLRLKEYERDENNLVTRIVEPGVTTGANLVTELAYDAVGNITTKREAVGTAVARVTTYEYGTNFNRITRVVDPAGEETRYEYDAKGNLTKQTSPDGKFRTYTYNAQGLVLTETDERGKTSTNVYDEYGRLTSVTAPDGSLTTYTRTATGNPAVTIRGNGTPAQQMELAFFDAKNRPIMVIDGENNIAQTVYDQSGNVLKTIDPTKLATSRGYDNKGRPSTVSDPSAGTSTAVYDLNDNLTKVTTADGEASNLEYDTVNRLTEATDALGTKSRMAYDARDNLIAVTDGRGNTTTFAYDALDRLTSRTNAAGNTWSFEYDALDRRIATIKPDGTRVDFAYDELSRLVSAGVSGNSASQRSYSYDEAGNLLTAIAAAGSPAALDLSFAYDDVGQLTTAGFDGASFPAWSFGYEYDALGRRIVMRDSAGAVTQYLYDDADRLTGMTLPSGKQLALEYDAAGRRMALRFPNGLAAVAAYDTAPAAASTGRLTSIAHGLSATGTGGSALNQRLGTASYSYDTKGDIVGISETTTPPRARNATLDVLSRLTEVKDSAGQTVESYGLDEEGNRITSHRSSTHTTRSANRLVEDETHQFEYDVNGNQIRKTVKATGLSWHYGYSVYDELISVGRYPSATSADLTVAYAYDALGRRALEERRDDTGQVTARKSFLHDGEHVAAEAGIDTNGAATAPRRYSHTDGVDDIAALTLPAGQDTASPTAEMQGPDAPAAASYYYSTDHQSSVRAITNDAGLVVNEYSYDSYGNPETAVDTLKQPFRFTGREYDSETGLFHYRARAFDPQTGRFLQEDPIWFEAGDLNVYRYVWNNPTNWTDPSGLNASGEYAGVAGIITRAIVPIAKVGNAISCIFNGIAGVLNVINQISAEGATVESVAFTAVYSAGGWALECGGKGVGKIAPKSCKLQQPARFFPKVASFIAANLRYANSFTEGTLVLTKDGYRPIEEVKVGDLVAAIDEITGKQVWRKVIETYNRQAPATLAITLEGPDGKRQVIEATPEHPFHLEGWDGSTGAMMAALESDRTAVNDNGQAASDATLSALAGPRLFPSEGKTRFGEWIKAGALKQGDTVSTPGSVSANATALRPANDNRADAQSDRVFAPTQAANDNRQLVVSDILLSDHAARVYNFEVESFPGQETHNYLVGDLDAWVHNGRYIPKWVRDLTRRRITGPDGKMKCEYCGTEVFDQSGSACSLEFDHMDPVVGGGSNDPGNVAGACRTCNRQKGGKPFADWFRRVFGR